MQERREKANKEKLEKIKAGEKGSKKEREADGKQLSRGFVANMRKDSDYIGEDYEVFSSWLQVTQ